MMLSMIAWSLNLSGFLLQVLGGNSLRGQYDHICHRRSGHFRARLVHIPAVGLVQPIYSIHLHHLHSVSLFVRKEINASRKLFLALLTLMVFYRLFSIVIFIPINRYVDCAEIVGWKNVLVMGWGGLRGAVALMLALAVSRDPRLDRRMVGDKVGSSGSLCSTDDPNLGRFNRRFCRF